MAQSSPVEAGTEVGTALRSRPRRVAENATYLKVKQTFLSANLLVGDVNLKLLYSMVVYYITKR